MGTVYLATHVRLGQQVAIKVLHERYSGDKKLIRRFENEALTYGQVNHPNLVGLHDFGRTDNGMFFMVLEYCPGVALSTLLRQQGKLEPRLASDLILQIAQGLSAAHAQGIIHRDLKPENVILTETRPGRYHARLLDFGIAKQIDDDGPRLTQAGMVFGTPEYMSPEQARGKSVDARSDIYALGTMLFELLCGDPPFTGSDKLRIMQQQASEKPPRPGDFEPGVEISKELEVVVMTAIAKKSAARYQSTTEFIDALDEASRPERLTPAPLPELRSGARVDDSGLSRLHELVDRASRHHTLQESGWGRSLAGRLSDTWMSIQPSVLAAVMLFAIGATVTVLAVMGDDDESKTYSDPPNALEVVQTTSEESLTVPAEDDGVEALHGRTRAEQEAAAAAQAQRDQDAAVARKKAAERKRVVKSHLSQARTALKAGRFARAENAVRKALKVDGDHRQAKSLSQRITEMKTRFEAGTMAYNSGNCTAAISSMEQVLKSAPQTAKARTIISKCRIAQPPTRLN